MDKIKIHELAKQLGMTSKEVLSMANELGANVTSHLSTIDEDMAKKIKSKTNNNKSIDKSKEKKSNIQEKKTEEQSPVIIRRAIIMDDEGEKKKEIPQDRIKRDVGSVVGRKNNNYNIVYRNKPTKPMTASELFGLNKKKKEEKPSTEKSNHQESCCCPW